MQKITGQFLKVSQKHNTFEMNHLAVFLKDGIVHFIYLRFKRCKLAGFVS